jgi:aryl-phospho-beta-D-glucosidase BglC (GH1 family)
LNYAKKKLAFACLILLPIFIIPMLSTQPIVYAAVASAPGSLGWGGYITSSTMADSILNTLDSDGYTAVRYQAVPSFLPSSSSHRINYAVLDHIVSKGASLGISVIIDPVHNYPESTAYTMQSHFSEWQSILRTVGARYNGKTNVILECVNEYKLSDAKTKFQTIVTDLRNRGITLPLHFNYMWGSTVGVLTPPKDPLNKVSIGHHIYADHDYDNSQMRSGETWVAYCTRLGIEDRMKRMFTSTTTTWFGYALSHGTKVLLTEVGGGHEGQISLYNVAFVIRTFEYAKKYGVGIIGFRVGDISFLSTYKSYAQKYFGRSLY